MRFPFRRTRDQRFQLSPPQTRRSQGGSTIQLPNRTFQSGPGAPSIGLGEGVQLPRTEQEIDPNIGIQTGIGSIAPEYIIPTTETTSEDPAPPLPPDPGIPNRPIRPSGPIINRGFTEIPSAPLPTPTQGPAPRPPVTEFDIPPSTGGPIFRPPTPPPKPPVYEGDPPRNNFPVGKIYTKIDRGDMLPLRSETITYGIWSNSVGNLTSFYTCSTSAATESFHWTIYNDTCGACSSAPQFDIAYGHDAGSGSVDLGGYDWMSPTNAIYGQYRLLCLGGSQKRFTIGHQELDDIYVINVRYDRMQDKLDEGNIELNLAHLSGSEYVAGGNELRTHTGSNVTLAGNSQVLRLIDDSTLDLDNDLDGTTYSGSYSEMSSSRVHRVGQGGRVFHMVSGSIEQGIYNKTNPHVYGLMYPDLGIIVLDATRLDNSASFGTVTTVEVAGNNSQKLWLAMSGAAQYTDASGDTLGFQARRKVVEWSNYYFIRVKNSDYNFTNNPTYLSGSEGIIDENFRDEPKVYMTSIGLYNDRKELLAIGKLSRPVLKSCTTEGLFKLRLKY